MTISGDNDEENFLPGAETPQQPERGSFVTTTENDAVNNLTEVSPAREGIAGPDRGNSISRNDGSILGCLSIAL